MKRFAAGRCSMSASAVVDVPEAGNQMRAQRLAPRSDEIADAGAPVVVARQPILDRSEAIAGYELLYRPMPVPAVLADPEAASASVIVRTFADIGLERLVGDQPAYINVTREFLLAVRPLPLPPQRVVIELVEDQAADAALIEVVADAVDAGFRLALDDFAYRPELEPLLELASVVKLDIRALDGVDLIDHVARLRDRDVALIAEKVETREEYELCRAMGFDGFQGYFFAKPSLVPGAATPTHGLGALSALVQPVQRATFEELERVIAQDAGLSHKLLRLSNSAFIGARHRVASVRQALMLLGTVAVRRWATLLVLAGLTDRPHVLLGTGLMRARLCEQLGGPGSRRQRRARVHGRALLGRRRPARHADAHSPRRAAARRADHRRALGA